mgnify:CR=1 FL=1
MQKYSDNKAHYFAAMLLHKTQRGARNRAKHTHDGENGEVTNRNKL